MNKYFFAIMMAVVISYSELNGIEQNMNPQYLYKIVSPEQWQESLLGSEIVLSPMDKEFIHLSKEDQVSHVVQKFWDNKQYVVLKLSTEKLKGRLTYETNPGGTTQYYHLYEGHIPLDAVVDLKSQKEYESK